ncbi:MAG TPA: right-handed parallel beta-helix repeat-containing protein, partial [Polyangia bacterium]
MFHPTLKNVLGPALVAALAFARPAAATTLYVSPTGTAETGCTTRANPCALASAAAAAVAGDTVVLMDGVYTQQHLWPANSGTASAWITFRADDCATPILEGPGVAPDVDDMDDVGVYSTTAEYVRFVGIVSRGWNEGFGNGWAGGTDSTAVSNGHWEIDSCISYSNGRTGFTFFSAPDFHLANSISAHNGSSTAASWSSGVTLFEATGTLLIEGNVSFENTDQQKHTDGSGFIADEMSSGATFVNNLAFGNSGSCLRLTRSMGTKFVNNTCYRNSQFGSMATGPTNPGELYFTNGGVTIQGVTFTNNVIVGTGQAPAGSQPIQNMPTSGWSNNVVTTGTPTFFTAPTGTNPSFVPASGDTMLTGK